jgi:hypothetical protein
MTQHSEIMICDFDAGMELVTESEVIPHDASNSPPHSDLVDPSHRGPPPGPLPGAPALELPPGWRGRPRSDVSSAFEVLNSGMWHRRSPGETRVKIDYSRVVSFFDPALSSLVEARTGQSKEEFRLDKISEADSQCIRDQLIDVFTRDGQGSGIDWGSITQVIVDRYGKRLELLRHILENPESKRNVTERAAEARSQVLIMLTPYMLTSAIPPNPTGPVDRSWIDPVAKHCASTHTSWTPEALLTPQETMIKGAVEEVLSRICSVLGDIWADAFDSEKVGIKELERFLEKWQSDIIKLMDWLGWSIWLKCNPPCGPEVSSRLFSPTGSSSLQAIAQEICYIPTWPWGYRSRDRSETVDMTPRCEAAVEPFHFLRRSGPDHLFS